jgi:hypothetical protein
MPQSKGTLIRGADGALHFIPDDQMQSFRLPDEHTAEARKMLDLHNVKAEAGNLPAIHGEGLVERLPTHNAWAVAMDHLQSVVRKRRS